MGVFTTRLQPFVDVVSRKMPIKPDRKKMKKLIVFAAVASVGLVGCADRAEDISAAYVSPLAYQSFSCSQVSQEASRVSSRVGEISGIQDKKAQNDAVATGVALVIFWPAAFLIKGDTQTAAELSRLKGELETLEQVSIQKNCGIVFERAQPLEQTADDEQT